MLVLKGEYEASEGLTAVDQLVSISANKHVTGVEQDPLEDAHNVVHFQTSE